MTLRRRPEERAAPDAANVAWSRYLRLRARASTLEALSFLAMVRYALARRDDEGAWSYATLYAQYRAHARSSRRLLAESVREVVTAPTERARRG